MCKGIEKAEKKWQTIEQIEDSISKKRSIAAISNQSKSNHNLLETEEWSKPLQFKDDYLQELMEAEEECATIFGRRKSDMNTFGNSVIDLKST